ncbi:MAG: putative membrane protein [Candidatus Beckwithbacteria bacterium GW2011_GWC2_49_11]|nr:MAG: putative membrane protein [Candidatus Beckwithbacteria bacterium GW2011_GWC2_49_11]
MLLSLLAFILTAILLYLSSRALIGHLIKLLMRLTHSQEATVNLLFFFLLPGVFLHEFSHILSAELLRVPTGELSLKPQLREGELRLGSAQIAATDPIRLTLIGTAPFVVGLIVLYLLIRVGLNLNLAENLLSQLQTLSAFLPFYRLALTLYLVFAIANTMFSSPSDLQAAGVPVVLILILLGVFKLANLNLPAAIPQFTANLFWLLASLFALILILNLALLLPLRFLKSLLR